jgi:hypothetical protein
MLVVVVCVGVFWGVVLVVCCCIIATCCCCWDLEIGTFGGQILALAFIQICCVFFSSNDNLTLVPTYLPTYLPHKSKSFSRGSSSCSFRSFKNKNLKKK